MERESQNGAYMGKVMTDEQMEMLRKQIAVYAAICEQLVFLHNSLSSQDPLSVGRLSGSPFFDPLVATSSGQRIGTRQRWTPTATQLQILEKIYEEGNGTPNKQKIKEIATELGNHGQVTETNVYNWFQNRRARSKRKQLQRPEMQQTQIMAEKEEEKWRRSGSLEESYEHILFPSPDLGIEHLLGKVGVAGQAEGL